MDKVHIKRIEADLRKGGFFESFMSVGQRSALLELLRGEEQAAFVEVLGRAEWLIRTAPLTYQTEKTATNDKRVYLHYFLGSADYWVIERDVGDTADGDGLGAQLQAFGYANLYGDGFANAELGYLSIAEFIEMGAELDLYWEPKTVGELLNK